MKALPRIETWVERIDADTVAVHAERAWDVAFRYSVFIIADATAWYYDWQKGYALRKGLDQRLHDFERQLHSFYGVSRFVKQWSADAESGHPYWGSIGRANPAH